MTELRDKSRFDTSKYDSSEKADKAFERLSLDEIERQKAEHRFLDERQHELYKFQTGIGTDIRLISHELQSNSPPTEISRQRLDELQRQFNGLKIKAERFFQDQKEKFRGGVYPLKTDFSVVTKGTDVGHHYDTALHAERASLIEQYQILIMAIGNYQIVLEDLDIPSIQRRLNERKQAGAAKEAK